MKNPRITARERGLLKGAIRRVFSRSDLRRQVLEASVTPHFDPTRLRVKTWVMCAVCKQPDAKSYIVIDHIVPVIDVNSSFEDMSLDEVVDRMWCEIENLQPICIACHKSKTMLESKTRRENKKRKKKLNVT